MKKHLLSAGGLLALAGLASCTDVTPLAPTIAVTPASRSASADVSSDEVIVSPYLARMNAELEAAGSNMRVLKAELLMDGYGWNGASSIVLIADDRSRGIGAEWVPGDPRRAGRQGVTYKINAGPAAPVPFAQQVTQIEEGMQAWRDQSCAAPITRVPSGPADIVQQGWFPADFFLALTPGSTDGNNIIGVTFSSAYITADGKFYTDIDRNGKADLSASQIFYNNRFTWVTDGRFGRDIVDYYSIITHETGHSLGLGHFGKVFVSKQAAADGSIFLSDIKYAPRAMMNAVYVTGRSEILGTDHSSFCQIWSYVK